MSEQTLVDVTGRRRSPAAPLLPYCLQDWVARLTPGASTRGWVLAGALYAARVSGGVRTGG